MAGFVSIVGAGPWDPNLLTLAGRARLRCAQVVIADYLVNPALFLHCPDAEVIQRQAGPRGGAVLQQQRINELMVEKARAGLQVVRLKGGDPCMFGRGGEEAQFLRAHGIEFEFVPGVSSPIAAPEYAGIAVTHRDHTPAVTFVSGYEAYEKAGLEVAWSHLARSAGTIVLMMSVNNARLNTERLIAAGRDPTTPAAVIRWGTRGIQRTIEGTLATIADAIERAHLRAPSIMILGEVVRLRREIAWFEQRPLFGRRVVLTRAAHQVRGWTDRLLAHGADVVALPSVRIVAADEAAFDACLQRLASFDGVIVSSANAVEPWFAGMRRCKIDARALATKTVIAVGKATAKACERHGIVPDLVPAKASSEGLVELLGEHDFLGRSWLHVRAAQGRSLLADAIGGAAGHYEVAVAYQTAEPAVQPMLLRSLAPVDDGGEGFDAIVFASGEAAKHTLAALARVFGDDRARAWIAASRIVTVGPVTSAAVRELGFEVAVQATEPGEQAVIDALTQALTADPSVAPAG